MGRFQNRFVYSTCDRGNNSSSERHSSVREVGMGSNMQVLMGDSTTSLRISFLCVCDGLKKVKS